MVTSVIPALKNKKPVLGMGVPEAPLGAPTQEPSTMLTQGPASLTGGKITAPAGASVAPALYSPEYYSQIRSGVESQLTSPEFAEEARRRRSQMAGIGVLSGTAYDAAQTGRVQDIRRSADTAVQQAMLEGAKYQAEAPERRKKELSDRAAMLKDYVGKGNTELDAEYDKIMRELTGMPVSTAAPGQGGASVFLPKPGGMEASQDKIKRADAQVEALAKNVGPMVEEIKRGDFNLGSYPESAQFLNDYAELDELYTAVSSGATDLSQQEIARYLDLANRLGTIVRTKQMTGKYPWETAAAKPSGMVPSASIPYTGGALPTDINLPGVGMTIRR